MIRYRILALVGVVGVLMILATAAAAPNNVIFPMVRSTTAVTAKCLPNAAGRVTIHSLGTVEAMHVEVSGLPVDTDFDFFVIQVPDKPFGMSWYQGDIETDAKGTGVGDFVGRFSVETFVVAPGMASAPDTFPSPPFPDATINPATGPIQMYHLGLWFNRPTDAAKAGCPSTETPFNGTHNAGVQALSTRNFPELSGPLRQIP